MKKILIAALILTIVLGTFVVYGDTADRNNIISFRNQNSRYTDDSGMEYGRGCRFNNEERQEFLEQRNNLTEEERGQWFKERTEYKRQEIKEALSNGRITEEQAKRFEEQLKNREEYHRENGFNDEFCHDQGFGREVQGQRGQGHLNGHGHGKGMGRGHRY